MDDKIEITRAAELHDDIDKLLTKLSELDNRAALQEIKQGLEDGLQTVDDRVNGFKIERLAEVIGKARQTITPTFITTQRKVEVAKEVKEVVTNMGRTSAQGRDEQVEISVRKATETTEAQTKAPIQEAMDDERTWVGEALRRMAESTDRKISEMRQHDSGGCDGNHRERKHNLISLKDAQTGKIQGTPLKAELTHWKCVALYLDAVDGWKGGSFILEKAESREGRCDAYSVRRHSSGDPRELGTRWSPRNRSLGILRQQPGRIETTGTVLNHSDSCAKR